MENPSIFGVRPLDRKYWNKSLFLNNPVKNQKTVSAIRPAENHEGVRPIFSLGQTDGIFVMLLLSFLFLTHIYRRGSLFFKESLSLVYSTSKKANQLNETTATDFWYNFVLLMQFVLMASITFFVFLQQQNTNYVPSHSIVFILLLMLGFMIAGSVKYLFYRFVGFVFDIQTTVRAWSRSYMNMLELMGVVAFIPVVFLIYSNYYSELLMFFLIGIFVLSRLIIIYRISIFFLRRKVNILFSISYLCSVEITPYFVLYKGLLYFYSRYISLSSLWL
jgi:hypothetical protein